jgi:hypothetical protein
MIYIDHLTLLTCNLSICIENLIQPIIRNVSHNYFNASTIYNDSQLKEEPLTSD